jgi:DNA-binding transcriptional LysR family regulator
MDRFAELQAFALVAASGGFSAAARQLGVATSSVTRQIDALELRLGAPLLNRSTRGVTLTDSGRAYYEQATAILAALDEADEGAGGRGAIPRGTLRVAAPVTFATMFIAPLLPELARRYPQLSLDLRLNDSMSNLAEEAIDLAIRIGNADLQPSLIARLLAPHARSICASPAYLARHGTPQAPSDLASHNCLQFSYGARRQPWRLRSAAGAVEEIEVRGSLTVNNSEVLRRAAVDGIGVVLLPDWLLQADIDSGALRRLFPGYVANPGDMQVGIFAVYPANRRGSSKIKAFADLLAEALA